MRVIYAADALDGLVWIIDYLRANFSEREIDRLRDAILEFEIAVLANPTAYPQSASRPEFRKAVLHKRCIFVYSLVAEDIIVTDAWDTRQDR